MVRTHVLTVLRNASAQVQAAIKDNTGGNSKISLSEGAETSVLYVRFEAAATELKLLMEAIESRAKSKEYGQVLTDCHTLYCEQRLSLVLFEGHFFQKICVIVLRRRAFDMFVSLVKRGCKFRYFQP
ncbi:unnamed protein product [Calypogeia fissa]